jgi:hypothetical protein
MLPLPAEHLAADQTHHVDVPVALLTSAMTLSAAEDFVAAFDSMHRGITVGQTTGGSRGRPLFFHLPGVAVRGCVQRTTEPGMNGLRGRRTGAHCAAFADTRQRALWDRCCCGSRRGSAAQSQGLKKSCGPHPR